jgi:protein SCO1/2
MIRKNLAPTRRWLLGQAFASLATFSGLSAVGQETSNEDHGGIVTPIDVPAIPLLSTNGSLETLTGMTRGKATAIQLMFAQCTTTCPIQAAIFQQVQKLLPDSARHRVQLLSISIDPENDTLPAIREWLHRFQAGSEWMAAVPRAKDLPSLQSLFGRARTSVESHSTQVHIVNQRSQIVWRSIELPSAESVAAVLSRI